jgi:hypothetical protein
MTRDFPERDWKVFRELHKVALGRLCDRILAEARAQIDQPAKSSHERYLSLFKLIQDRNDDIARGFDNPRRSTAILQIAIIRSMGLLMDEELRRFSPETIEIIERYKSVSDA